MTGEPRADRWIRLYDLGRALQRSDPALSKLGRRSLRRKVHRMVREAETFHGEIFTMRWRNRLYVNVSALDRIKPPDDQRLGQLESNQANAAAKIRHLERQSQAHGARIRKLEKWRDVSQRFLVGIAEIERDENASKTDPNLGRVRAYAR